MKFQTSSHNPSLACGFYWVGYLYKSLQCIVISFSLQTALAVGDVKDVQEIAEESRIKLQVEQEY